MACSQNERTPLKEPPENKEEAMKHNAFIPRTGSTQFVEIREEACECKASQAHEGSRYTGLSKRSELEATEQNFCGRARCHTSSFESYLLGLLDARMKATAEEPVQFFRGEEPEEESEERRSGGRECQEATYAHPPHLLLPKA